MSRILQLLARHHYNLHPLSLAPSHVLQPSHVSDLKKINLDHNFWKKWLKAFCAFIFLNLFLFKILGCFQACRCIKALMEAEYFDPIQTLQYDKFDFHFGLLHYCIRHKTTSVCPTVNNEKWQVVYYNTQHRFQLISAERQGSSVKENIPSMSIICWQTWHIQYAASDVGASRVNFNCKQFDCQISSEIQAWFKWTGLIDCAEQSAASLWLKALDQCSNKQGRKLQQL